MKFNLASKNLRLIFALQFLIFSFDSFAINDLRTFSPVSVYDSSYVINPENLRKYILEGNNNVLMGLNSIYLSKDQVNIARANLLPSLDLRTLAGPSGFNLSTISFLFPFLAPSNWFNLSQSSLLLEAEKDSYFVIQLNVYASALGLYQSMVGDLALREVYNQNYLVLKELAEVIEAQAREIGATNSQDVLEAKAQVSLALNKLKGIDLFLVKEKAALRKALGMEASLEKMITIEMREMPQSPYEIIPMKMALDAAQMLSPEKRQLEHLIMAAEKGKWSTMFAFMGSGGGSLSASSGALGGTPSFENLSGNYSFRLTFATVPSVQLSNDNIAQLRLRQDELYLEQRATVEATVGAIKIAKEQIEQAKDAYDKFTEYYEIEYQRYFWGASELIDLLQAQSNRVQAMALVVQNKVNLNTLRVNLQRVTMSEEFLKVKGCNFNAAAAPRHSTGFFDWFREIFDSGVDKTNINAICKNNI